MRFKLKPLSSISALALTTAITGGALTACSGSEGEGASHSVEGESTLSAAPSVQGGHVDEAHLEGANVEGGASRYAEGGESEGSVSTHAAQDNTAFLTQLGLMRGHLHAFYALYKSGALANAATHAKHPESELYTDLVPALAAREIEGFASALAALSTATSESGAIDVAYETVVQQITRVERASGASEKEKLLSIAHLIRVAGDEYKIGVAPEGTISNLHEYQDAYGFVEIAKQRLSALESASGALAEATDKSTSLVADLSDNFDGWTPDVAPGKSSAIYGAAARIELLALGL